MELQLESETGKPLVRLYGGNGSDKTFILSLPDLLRSREVALRVETTPKRKLKIFKVIWPGVPGINIERARVEMAYILPAGHSHGNVAALRETLSVRGCVLPKIVRDGYGIAIFDFRQPAAAAPFPEDLFDRVSR